MWLEDPLGSFYHCNGKQKSKSHILIFSPFPPTSYPKGWQLYGTSMYTFGRKTLGRKWRTLLFASNNNAIINKRKQQIGGGREGGSIKKLLFFYTLMHFILKIFDMHQHGKREAINPRDKNNTFHSGWERGWHRRFKKIKYFFFYSHGMFDCGEEIKRREVSKYIYT